MNNDFHWEIVSQDGHRFTGEDRTPSLSERTHVESCKLWVHGRLFPYKVTVPKDGLFIFFIRHRQFVEAGTMEVKAKEREYWIGSRVGPNKDVLQIFNGKATRHDSDGRLISLRREGVCNRCGACCSGCDKLAPPNTCTVWDALPSDKGCKVWPPHPFECDASFCIYHFYDDETGELVQAYRNKASLQQYAPVRG